MKSLRLCGIFWIVVLVGTAAGQDPGIPDTIRVEGDTLVVGQSTPITVSIFSDSYLRGFDLSFLLDPFPGGFAVFDSIVYVNRMSDPRVLDLRPFADHILDGNPPDTIGFAAYRATGELLPAGGGVVAEIYLTGVTPGRMRIAEGEYPPVIPRNYFILDPDNRGIFAQFVGDTVTIVEGSPLPTLELPDETVREVAGSMISFDVVGQSAIGCPVELVLVSVVGYDDESETPAIPPSLTATNPAQFDWQTLPGDIGIWLATFRACDSIGGVVTREVEIQLVESGKYVLSFELSETQNAPNVLSVHHGNFDDDPYPEILATGDGLRGTRTFAVFVYNVSDHLQEAFSLTDGGHKRAAQIGFFNEDDILDAVVVGFQSGDRIGVYHGNGDNTFSVHDMTEAAIAARGSALGEFTDDQYLDYATVWYDGVRIYAGDGASLFRYALHLGTVDTALSVNSADFNGDGNDDLAVGTKAGLEIYLNTGAGGFDFAHSYSQVYSSVDIEVTNEGTDFNNDNIFDLCLATPSLGGTHSEIMVYLGNGDGSFLQSQARLVKGHVLANRVGDFNNDGNLDVVYVNGSHKYVAVMFGDGSGAFTNEVRFGVPKFNPRKVICLDVDLDGDLDIVVAAYSIAEGSSLFLYQNQHDPGDVYQVSIEITGRDNADIELSSASGKVINKVKKSMPASDYYRRNTDQNDKIDDYVSVNVVEDGRYVLTVMPKPNLSTTELFSLEFKLDGEAYRLAKDAPMTSSGYQFTIYPTGNSDVLPMPGEFVDDNPPTFVWPGFGSCDFELASDIEFANVLVSVTVPTNSFTPPSALTVSDTAIFYWRVKPSGAATFEEFSSVNIVRGTLTDVDEQSAELPDDFSVSQNYPNPFNPITVVEYAVPTRCNVEIVVYDILGRKVATLVNNMKPAGTYEAQWDGKDEFGNRVSSGIYLYRIEAGDFVQSRKMLLLK